jgi:hypothetical protein
MNRPNPSQEAALILRSYQLNDIDCHRWMTCINCEEWSNKAEECVLYRIKPPLMVMITGCEKWTPSIPF